VDGIADCLDRDPRLTGEEWVKNLRLFFTQDAGRFEETLLGIHSAKSILEGRFPIRVMASSDNPDRLRKRREETPS